jgi:hypothetical protein
MAKHFSRRYFLLAVAGVGGTAVLVRWDGGGVQRSAVTGPQLSSLELKYAQQRADLCGAGNAVGVGLRGEYFAQADLAGPALLTRIDRFVDFDAGFDWPSDQARPRSARWAGWIKPALTGAYRFHADAPGLKVSVGPRVVADAAAHINEPVEMALGRFYPITIEAPHLDAGFNGRWRLEWTAPHGMRYVVPTALLFMPTNATT